MSPKVRRRRSSTISRRQLTRELRRERELGIVDVDLDLERIRKGMDAERPRTRGDCADGPRPCPWVGCRWNVYLDVSPATGSIKLNFPGRELHELQDTCALDVADRGGVTLEVVGSVVNMTRERVRQIEEKALVKLRQVSSEDVP